MCEPVTVRVEDARWDRITPKRYRYLGHVAACPWWEAREEKECQLSFSSAPTAVRNDKSLGGNGPHV